VIGTATRSNGTYAASGSREAIRLSSSVCHIEVIEDPARFTAIREAWNALLEGSSSNSLTVTWEWMSTWWHVYCAARSLRLVAVWDGTTLVGAAPLLARHSPVLHFGVLPFKRWELLASGESAGDEICSDYLDWIAAAGRETEVVALILDHLVETQGAEWQEILLPDVSSTSVCLRQLQNTCGNHKLLFEILKREQSPYIRLPGTWDAYLASVSSSFRYKLRRGRRDFEQQGGRYRVAESIKDIDELFPILIDLHQARWAARGLPGAFASALRRQFHSQLLPLALQRGWLRLGVLSLPTGPIGAIYSFRYARRVYFYQSGIAPQDSSHLRPGTLLHGYEIEAAIAAGFTEYDFLKQGGPDYKDDWANAAHELVCVRIARAGPRHQALCVARLTHAKLRAIKRRVTR
jgi:CelD/BcsL family acetyltransferase involved in cellulose biosynthesis